MRIHKHKEYGNYHSYDMSTEYVTSMCDISVTSPWHVLLQTQRCSTHLFLLLLFHLRRDRLKVCVAPKVTRVASVPLVRGSLRVSGQRTFTIGVRKEPVARVWWRTLNMSSLSFMLIYENVGPKHSSLWRMLIYENMDPKHSSLWFMLVYENMDPKHSSLWRMSAHIHIWEHGP